MNRTSEAGDTLLWPHMGLHLSQLLQGSRSGGDPELTTLRGCLERDPHCVGATLERDVSQIPVGLVGVALRQKLDLGDVAVIRFLPVELGTGCVDVRDGDRQEKGLMLL